MNGIVITAPLGAVMWGTYGLSVHQFGFARGSLVWFAGVTVVTCVGAAVLNRGERRRVAEQRFVDDTIDAMEADWYAPPSMWN